MVYLYVVSDISDLVAVLAMAEEETGGMSLSGSDIA